MKVIESLPHPQRRLQLFCIVDELIKIILTQTRFLEKSGKTPGRPHNLTVSEAMTISLYSFLFPWTDFKHYYSFVKNYHGLDFSALPHYDNMLSMQKQLLPFFIKFLGVLIAINKAAFKNKKIRIMFIDASPLPVCANKRIFNNKVARKAAKRGKSTMGWFCGFKLHILVDTQGNLLGVTITPGNVDDRTQVKKLVGDIMDALLVADGGYLKELLREELLEKNNIQFVTGVKRTMKKLMTLGLHSMLRARQLVETVIGSCKHRLGMTFRLHRSIEGYQVHFVLTLIAYTLFKSLSRMPFCLPARNYYRLR